MKTDEYFLNDAKRELALEHVRNTNPIVAKMSKNSEMHGLDGSTIIATEVSLLVLAFEHEKLVNENFKLKERLRSLLPPGMEILPARKTQAKI